jgi:Flp pilus assembly protein TadB
MFSCQMFFRSFPAARGTERLDSEKSLAGMTASLARMEASLAKTTASFAALTASLARSAASLARVLCLKSFFLLHLTTPRLILRSRCSGHTPLINQEVCACADLITRRAWWAHLPH